MTEYAATSIASVRPFLVELVISPRKVPVFAKLLAISEKRSPATRGGASASNSASVYSSSDW